MQIAYYRREILSEFVNVIIVTCNDEFNLNKTMRQYTRTCVSHANVGTW